MEEALKIYEDFFDLEGLIAKISAYNPTFDRKKFIKALLFAEKAHSGQMRKDGKSPYITHPVAVVEILAELKADEDVLIAGLLHDVPEDTDKSIEDIENIFGKEIAFLVGGITKLSKVQYQNNMSERSVESLKKLFIHSAKDIRVILIKLADRLHNMRTLHFVEKPEKRVRIASETLEIHVPMANLLGISVLKTKLEDLCFKYLFPQDFEKVENKIQNAKRKHEEELDRFIAVLKGGLEKNKIKAEIKSRRKGLYRAYKRILTSGKSIDHLKDRVAVRVVVAKIAQCYSVLGVLHSFFKPNLKSFKDYIATPKPNGYRSLHSLVFGINGLLTEVQIQTKKMALNSDYGVMAHYFENTKGKKISTSLINRDNRSSWVSKMIEVTDNLHNSENFLEDLKLDVLQERIFTFTPKGRTIDLPKGASVLDFAYSIHSDLGNHAEKAEINGMMMPISTELRTGDVVRVIDSETTHPNLTWLSFARTSLAKKRISHFLRSLSKTEKKARGREVLQRSLDLANMGLLENINLKKYLMLINKETNKNFINSDELFENLGEGTLQPAEIAKILGKMRSETQYKFALSEVDLKIDSKNRFGLMKDIYRIIYKYASDIIYFHGWSKNNNTRALFKIKIAVEDMQQVEKIVNELEEYEDVHSVYRVNREGVVVFYTLCFVTAVLWLLHPILLLNPEVKKFLNSAEIWADLVIFLGTGMLLTCLLAVTRTLNNYFPLLRDHATLWSISTALVTLAGAVLVLELVYAGIGKIHLPISAVITFAYFYLGYHLWRSYFKSKT